MAKRAILLLQTRAAGSDIDAQAAAATHPHAVCPAAGPPADARLVMSGPGLLGLLAPPSSPR
jgi:hypothetical protein